MLRKTKGFTLMEVMIVIAIIGIFAAIFVPLFLVLQQELVPNTIELTVQEESKIVEQPKTTIKEPTENQNQNQIEEKDLKKL